MPLTVFDQNGEKTFAAYLLTFAQAVPGTEPDLVERLRHASPRAWHFKVFGTPDVLEVVPLSSLGDAVHAGTVTDARAIASFPCLFYRRNGASIQNAFEAAVSPALAFIKIDGHLAGELGAAGIFHLVNYLAQAHPEAHVLLGLGYHELGMWIDGSSFEFVFDTVQKIRETTIAQCFPDRFPTRADHPVFSATVTTPLLSYHNVILPQAFDRVQGAVAPVVRVKCSPGDERRVLDMWKVTWAQCLGSEDLVFSYPEPVPASEFIRDLLSFRREVRAITSMVDTFTQLRKTTLYEPKGRNLEDPERYTELFRFNSTGLESRKGNQLSNKIVIQELLGAVAMLRTSIREKYQYNLYHDIVWSLLYLQGLVDEYVVTLDTEAIPAIADVELRILDYLRYFDAALAQYLPDEELSQLPRKWSRPSFEHSLCRVIRATSVIPEFLFKAVAEAAPPESLKRAAAEAGPGVLLTALEDWTAPWKGFIIAETSHSYELINEGEIIYVPYGDIFRPLNWLTLSHEVSHAIFERLAFLRVEDGYLTDISAHVAARGAESHSRYLYNMKDLFSEFFAHWFDYRHFFGGDLDFYIWSIWRTYFWVPRVYQAKEEYWLRTLFVKVCHEWPTLRAEFEAANGPGVGQQEEVRRTMAVLARCLEEITAAISGWFPKHYAGVELTPDQRTDVIRRMSLYYDFCRHLGENYLFPEVVAAVEQRDVNFEDSLENVWRGGVVETGLANPFLMLREVLRKSFTARATKLPDAVTLALTVSLWDTSRLLVRPLERLND